MNRETFQAIRDLLMEKLDMSREMTDREILDEIDQLILNRMRDSYISLNEKLQLRQELFYSVRKLDVLQELIEDETVTEIMVNGPDVIQQIAGRCNRVINESMPIVDARLENGARVNAVISPVALNGPILTIRRFPDTPITMDRLIALGSLTCECARFLKALVRARYSIVLGGGTGSGKTTFLGALSDYIPEDERIITIEDNAELKIQGVENLVRLEAKMANMEGTVSVSIRDLIKTALRMRPDRIVVGEVRRQSQHSSCKFCQRHAQPSGNNDAYGGGSAVGGNTETDCLGGGYSDPSGPNEGQNKKSTGDYRSLWL